MVEDSPSRGKFWKLPSGSAAGDWYPPVRIEGSEKEEWFYTSVRFPDGIEKTSLTAQDSEVQQLVVSWWFILNYRKSEADEPLHYDGSVKYDGSQRHDGTQRGQDFSIKPLESVHVLTNEFRPALSDERIASLAQLFPGVWEPIGPVMPLLADTDHSPAATKAAIPKGLDALAEQIEHLPAQDEEQPWTGSNHPPEPLDEPEPPPIRPEDKEQALAAMSEVRHLVWADASLQAIRAAWGKLSLFLAKVGAWAAQQIRNYLPELIKGGVQQAGKDGFEYLAAAIRSCDLGQMIGRWIRDLFS